MQENTTLFDRKYFITNVHILQNTYVNSLKHMLRTSSIRNWRISTNSLIYYNY